MGILDTTKYIIIGVLCLCLFGCLYYISTIKADLAVSQQNEKALKLGIKEQGKALQQKHNDIKLIKKANESLANTMISQQKELEKLKDKFNTKSNGQSRDLGEIARTKPGLVNKIINRATKNVNRCFELVTGANLKDGEKNNECKEIINSISN